VAVAIRMPAVDGHGSRGSVSGFLSLESGRAETPLSLTSGDAVRASSWWPRPGAGAPSVNGGDWQWPTAG